MYVCLCKGVTDRQIKSAIAEGATSVGQLRKCLGVASQCGKCGITTREILEQQLVDQSQESVFDSYYAIA
jgi:bacterioferritin-associated ferredoxin